MDSSASGTPASQAQASRSNSFANTHLSDMNGTEPISAATDRQTASEATASHENSNHANHAPEQPRPAESGTQSVGPSPALAQQTPGPTTMANSNPSTSLSGLVCNVHRTTGREPHPLVGASTTILGDKLYVFGGRVMSRTRPQLTADLYELDLVRRHWTKIETRGDIPPPRYFHTVCALGDSKLVCYGGMSPAASHGDLSASGATGQNSANAPDPQPEAVVLSDIHIYDVPSRTWMYVPAADTPQGRYAHCATILPSSGIFTSANAPLSAIHHNPASPTGNPNQGSIGVALDGTGGAEMVVVGGQDSKNHYIEQISVFNLRSLKWTATDPLGKSCGAYRSVVAPLTGIATSRLGKISSQRSESNASDNRRSNDSRDVGSSMLIYSNYNFLDVKLELQVRLPNGSLMEKPMRGSFSPPGLRFPNGGVIDKHFVVSGTYLTSSKQEYALWALDLRNLTWSRIDAGGNHFSQGSWNRGVLWKRRNMFVVLGNRKRSLVEDYNHRRINFTNICLVELEAFGMYDNPRTTDPTSGFISASAPSPSPLLPAGEHQPSAQSGGGRPLSAAAESLGRMALNLRELADMDFLAIDGERVPVNSAIIARRWGPYFNQLLREAVSVPDTLEEQSSLRPPVPSIASRNSSITITPSIGASSSSTSTIVAGNQSTSVGGSGATGVNRRLSNLPMDYLSPPTPQTLSPIFRSRTLYLPHTHLTLQTLVHYLYTSSLPPPSHPLCTPQTLCSLLQLARPYRIDGLLEAVVERLHQVLDGRNAAAVFNAAAMAAGGGLATASSAGRLARLNGMNLAANNRTYHYTTAEEEHSDGDVSDADATNHARHHPGRRGTTTTNTTATTSSRPLTPTASEDGDDGGAGATAAGDNDDVVSTSAASTTASTATTATNNSEYDLSDTGLRGEREIWSGEISSVVGLQKRGLRGLMEGRRMRERGRSQGPNGTGTWTGNGSFSQGGGSTTTGTGGSMTATAAIVTPGQVFPTYQHHSPAQHNQQPQHQYHHQYTQRSTTHQQSTFTAHRLDPNVNHAGDGGGGGGSSIDDPSATSNSNVAASPSTTGLALNGVVSANPNDTGLAHGLGIGIVGNGNINGIVGVGTSSSTSGGNTNTNGHEQ